ncbi:MAG TPA: lytic murein transglycosylase, partial [Pseudonocardiaceae bacterium]
MQFIPSTWAQWAADGDGDGKADPQDLDDAALAAARYLCAGNRDLGTGKGWWAAVMSYNNSVEYAQKVFGLADTYARASIGR